jgi:hypothetical protein
MIPSAPPCSLVVFAQSRSTLFHARNVFLISGFFLVWYLALAVSYSALRHHGVYDCFAPGPGHGLYVAPLVRPSEAAIRGLNTYNLRALRFGPAPVAPV